MKKERSFEIYDSMSFKFKSKVYTQGEKHPISKERFEAGSNLIKNLISSDSTS